MNAMLQWTSFPKFFLNFQMLVEIVFRPVWLDELLELLTCIDQYYEFANYKAQNIRKIIIQKQIEMPILKSQRTDITDPEFLTFRNNPINNNQNTGRSVFSQQINNYKSLEKYQIAESQQPVRNFRKKLKGVRSQQKLQRGVLPGLKVMQTYNQQNSNESSNNQLKNQILRKKLQRIVKKIKSEQRKQIALQGEIIQLQNSLIQDQKFMEDQIGNIEELQEIFDENNEQIRKYQRKYQEQMSKNDKYAQILQEKQQQIQNLMEGSVSIFSNNSNNSSSSSEYRQKQVYIQKLVNGLGQVQRMKEQMQNRYKRMQNQISKMRGYIQNLREINIIVELAK